MIAWKRLLAILLVALMTAACVGSAASPPPASQDQLATAQFADDSGGISLTYPSSWTLVREDHPAHYESTIGFLGTGSAHQDCPSDYQPGLGACTDVYDLAPETFVIRVVEIGGPPVQVSQVSDLLTFHPDATPLTVDSETAAVEVLTTPVAGDLSISWTLPHPGMPWAAYRLTASFRGPDIATGRTVVEGVVTSARFISAQLPGQPTRDPLAPPSTP